MLSLPRSKPYEELLSKRDASKRDAGWAVTDTYEVLDKLFDRLGANG
jgi:hypothetical protein